MTDTTLNAQIYLADQRGCSQTAFFRSYHTFNFGPYTQESRQPFGALHLLNEDTLRPGARLTMQVDQPTQVLLLPVTGGLEYGWELAAGTPVTGFLEPGQVGILALAAGTSYTIGNPYEKEYIDCIQIWLAQPTGDWVPSFSQQDFDLSQSNTLLPILGGTHSRAYIGQYGGRREGVILVEPPKGTSRLFAFVLKGVFEVANRLLHEKDGLALQYSQTEAMEFEALSNDAILILLTV